MGWARLSQAQGAFLHQAQGDKEEVEQTGDGEHGDNLSLSGQGGTGLPVIISAIHSVADGMML